MENLAIVTQSVQRTTKGLDMGFFTIPPSKIHDSHLNYLAEYLTIERDGRTMFERRKGMHILQSNRGVPRLVV